MKGVENKEDYERFIEDIVQGNIENDGSSLGFVAKHVVQAFTQVGDEVACYYSCEPYTTEWERIAPYDVFRYTNQYLDVENAEKWTRKTAVELLEGDLRDKLEEMENA